MSESSGNGARIASLIGENTGIRLSVVFAFGAALLWFTTQLQGIRSEVSDVGRATEQNTLKLEALRDLVAVQLQNAAREDSDIRAELKDLQASLRELQAKSGGGDK